MTLRFTIFLFISISFVSLSYSQKKQPAGLPKIKWLAPANLPAGADGKAHPGLAGAVSGILHNTYIIAGGANFPEAMPWEGGKKQYYSDIYLYDQLPDGNLKLREKQGKLPVPLAYPAIAQGEDMIFVAGGETPEGLTNACFSIQKASGSGRLLLNPLPSLPVPAANAASFILGSEWLVAGGETRDGTTDKVWKLNIENPSEGWKAAPSLPQALAFATLAGIKNNKGENEWLIGGGRCRIPGSISRIFSEVYTLHQTDSSWQKSVPLPYAISAMSSTVLPGGSWMIFGGDRGETFSQVEKLLLEIAAAATKEEKLELEAAKSKLQKSHPGFNAGVWVWQPETGKWMAVESIAVQPPVTTHAIFSKGNIYIGSGEIRAGVRTPYILHAQLQE